MTTSDAVALLIRMNCRRLTSAMSSSLKNKKAPKPDGFSAILRAGVYMDPRAHVEAAVGVPRAERPRPHALLSHQIDHFRIEIDESA